MSSGDNMSQASRHSSPARGLKKSPSGKLPTKYRSSTHLREQTSAQSSGIYSRQGEHSTPERNVLREAVPTYPTELSRGHIPPYPFALTSHQYLGYSDISSDPNVCSESHDSQLESLEALLSRAGYKETRVFTPEAEKVKAFARKVYKTWDEGKDGRSARGSGLRRTVADADIAGDRSTDSIESTNSPLKRWGNAVVKQIQPGRSREFDLPSDGYQYIEPSLPPLHENVIDPTLQLDSTAVQGASSSLRNILATDDQRVSRSKSVSPVGSMISSASRLRSRSPDPTTDRISRGGRVQGVPSHAFDVFDQAIHERVERIARGSTTAESHTMSGTQTTNSSGSGIGRKRRVLNRVELDFPDPSTTTSPPVTEPNSIASSMVSVTTTDPSFGNAVPAPDSYYGIGTDADLRFKTISIDDIDDEEFEEVARVEYSLSRHVFPPHAAPQSEPSTGPSSPSLHNVARFDPMAYEAEDTDEAYSVEYGDQVDGDEDENDTNAGIMRSGLGYASSVIEPRPGLDRGHCSDSYNSQADDTRSTISETDYGEIYTAAVARRTSGTPTLSSAAEHAETLVQASSVLVPPRQVFAATRRTIIPGSPPHVSTVLDAKTLPTMITTRVGERPLEDAKDVNLGDSLTARKLRHAISTPAFGKMSEASSSSDVPPLPALPFRAPSGGQSEGWLSKVGRVWSGSSSLISNTSKETLENPKPVRVPVALSRVSQAPARPASPRVHRGGPVVCNTQEGEDLPPVAPGLGKAIVSSSIARGPQKRGLRTMFSLQNLRSAVAQPVAPVPIVEEESETPLSPTLSPRLNWDARDLWDPQPLGGFNTLYQQQQQPSSFQDRPARTIYPEPDFTKSFFYSPMTPPTGQSKSAAKKAKHPPLQPKRQQSIKSLRAALEKDTARLISTGDIPPVPALPKHLGTPQKSGPTPPMIAISSPNSCEAGLPPRALSLEGEDWEGGSFESRKERERRMKKSVVKRRRSGLRHSKTAA